MPFSVWQSSAVNFTVLFVLCIQKSEPSRDDRGSAAVPGAPSSSTSVGRMMSPSSSTHDDLATSVATERQQHGVLPDLLPPQIPPRASQADKTVSEEVDLILINPIQFNISMHQFYECMARVKPTVSRKINSELHLFHPAAPCQRR